jgi:hypothetical protein
MSDVQPPIDVRQNPNIFYLNYILCQHQSNNVAKPCSCYTRCHIVTITLCEPILYLVTTKSVTFVELVIIKPVTPIEPIIIELVTPVESVVTKPMTPIEQIFCRTCIWQNR